MVCIPCIIAPVLLFIWYRFIQPIVLRFWNPWAPQKSVKNASNSSSTEKETNACPFSNKTSPEVAQTTEVTCQESSKKSD